MAQDWIDNLVAELSSDITDGLFGTIGKMPNAAERVHTRIAKDLRAVILRHSPLKEDSITVPSPTVWCVMRSEKGGIYDLQFIALTEAEAIKWARSHMRWTEDARIVDHGDGLATSRGADLDPKWPEGGWPVLSTGRHWYSVRHDITIRVSEVLLGAARGLQPGDPIGLREEIEELKRAK